MRYQRGERIKVIDVRGGFELETAFNSFVAKLEEEGKKYSYEFQPSVGFIIKYEVTKEIPENLKDEYELRGEKHHCIECPFYDRPTDGRRKYTHCKLRECLSCGADNCCEEFYDLLASGQIKLVEIGKEIQR